MRRSERERERDGFYSAWCWRMDGRTHMKQSVESHGLRSGTEQTALARAAAEQDVERQAAE